MAVSDMLLRLSNQGPIDPAMNPDDQRDPGDFSSPDLSREIDRLEDEPPRDIATLIQRLEMAAMG